MEKDKLGRSENGIIRALIVESQSEDYDFGCIAVPNNNKALKYNPSKKEYFYQILRNKQENILLDRMDSGLPIFDRHPELEDQTAMNTLGITVGYEFTDEGIFFKCKFGARADEALREDVKNKVIKTVSIEGTVMEYSEERGAGQVPVYYAELWEPESLHFAPVPNDIDSQIDVKRALDAQLHKTKKESYLDSLTKNF